MLQVENLLHNKKMGQDIPADFSDTRFYPCWYPPNKDTDYFNLLAFDEKGRAILGFDRG